MLEFTSFLRDAKKLSEKVTKLFISKQGCIGFFSALAPNNSAIEDAAVISLLAQCLEKSNDDALKNYIEKIPECSFISHEEFIDFKTRILVGIYLMKWSNYSSTMAYYANKPLIELFQQDLGIQSLEDMDVRIADASLEALSQFCSYVYENRHISHYADLSKQLGVTIQLDIHKVRKEKCTESSSWCGIYTGIMRTMGMSNLS